MLSIESQRIRKQSTTIMTCGVAGATNASRLLVVLWWCWWSCVGAGACLVVVLVVLWWWWWWSCGGLVVVLACAWLRVLGYVCWLVLGYMFLKRTLLGVGTGHLK